MLKIRFFTLVEILVVISILSIILIMLMPALSMAERRVNITKCENNLSQIQKLMAGYTIDYGGLYPPASNVWRWGEAGGWMNLISNGIEANKPIMKCPRDKGVTDFSYSLNCREIYLKTGTFGSWHDADFSKSTTGPSKIILVEETNYSFGLSNCDKDNYSQNAISFTSNTNYSQLNHKKYIPMLFVDGHVNSPMWFNTSDMTYFTDIMSAWYETDVSP